MVGTQVSGQIRDLLVDFNSEVKAGQLIAQIDPETCTPLLPPGVALDQATAQALAEVRGLVGEHGWSALRNGLSDDQNRHLAVTHRPAEIAMLVSLGLGRLPALSGAAPD